MKRISKCPYCEEQLDVSNDPEDQFISCHCEEFLYLSNQTEVSLSCYNCSEKFYMQNDGFDKKNTCTCGLNFTVTRIRKMLSEPIKKPYVHKA